MSDSETIARRGAEFIAALNRQDIPVLSDMRADDCIDIPPNRPAIKGLSAIQAFWLKRIAIGTIAGAVTLHIVGYLMFDLATAAFYQANNAAAATFTRISARASVPTVSGGLIAGAVLGLLIWFGVDFTLYGYESRWNLMLTIIDPLLAAIQFAVAGAVVAAVLTRVPKSAGIQPAR